ncbi:hypothetical protein [Conexibacter sp. SYSU D00693]|uniref:hypothetical protein n=1 Tax=Conexibacter sp. SYSU D00693 TaxID=2812560 RepID=UPI00196ACBAF|nr:hypothetical protein [Conexibacter sp. SYSU D00693]
MPPLRTGNDRADAQDDFLRARRRRALTRLLRMLGRAGDVDVILPFDEVVAALGRVGERDLGVQLVEVDSILGTVDRPHGFDREFRPTTARVRGRWERIATARRRGEPLPPVELFRVGDVHFVRDGHHRVSVARAMGDDVLEAHVVEVLTRVGADRTLRLSDLPLKSHERLFHERIPLPPQALPRVRLADSLRYGELAESIEAWGFRRGQEEDRLLDREELGRRWLQEELEPVCGLLHEADMVLPDESDADAYLRVACDRYRLLHTSEWSEDVLARLRERQR